MGVITPMFQNSLIRNKFFSPNSICESLFTEHKKYIFLFNYYIDLCIVYARLLLICTQVHIFSQLSSGQKHFHFLYFSRSA